jgi:hypothetical protein
LKVVVIISVGKVMDKPETIATWVSEIPKRMTQSQREAVVKALLEKHAVNPCPRCAFPETILIDGVFALVPQQSLASIALSSNTIIPFIITTCKNCGFMSQYNLAVLGLSKLFGAGQ